MIKTGAPKCLWDHCIELEGLVCSHTANDIYATDGEVPETVMKGGTADISQICKFAWYDWVMLRNTVNTGLHWRQKSPFRGLRPPHILFIKTHNLHVTPVPPPLSPAPGWLFFSMALHS
jgi:hypothetical protein